MASGFWYLEDGRCFAQRVEGMGYFLSFINSEIEKIEGAKPFSEYLSQFVPDDNDIPNGYGGFIKIDTNESIMQVFDLREFTIENRNYFWQGTQSALTKLIQADDSSFEGVIDSLKLLLEMHKRITKGESPNELNDIREPYPLSGKKLGPGWK
ncbi:MAG: hypothetical protein AB8H03_24750 [Saprospiraceae bacterium]